MTVIDLNAKKYQKESVVLKCGEREFKAFPDDQTLNRINKIGKAQMKDGLKASNKINGIDFDNIKDEDINTVVDTVTDTMKIASGDYIKLANAIFDDKEAGKIIYEYLGKSTLAMQDVLNDVVSELYEQKQNVEKKHKNKVKNKYKR